MSRNKEDKKRGAIISAVVIISVLAVFVGFIIFPLISELGGMLFAAAMLLVYGGGIVAVIFGVIAALRRRLEENEEVYQSMAKAVNPYGDGTACARIAEAIKWHIGFRPARPEEFKV